MMKQRWGLDRSVLQPSPVDPWGVEQAFWKPKSIKQIFLIEPPHDKTNKMAVRSLKSQISLCIRQSLRCPLNG